MKRIMLVLIVMIAAMSAAAADLTIHLDDELLARTAAGVFHGVDFTTGAQISADAVMVNGIRKKAGDNEFDYTTGIVDTVPGEGGGMNCHVIYDPEKLAVIMENIAEIMGLMYPEGTAKYGKEAASYRVKLEKYSGMRLKKTIRLAVYGYRYDHLLKYLGLEKINVDRYFIYKEKAYRESISGKILCDPEKDTAVLGGLESRGYNYFVVDYREFETVTDVIDYIIKEFADG